MTNQPTDKCTDVERERNQAMQTIAALERERNRLYRLIGQWAEDLQWADGLTVVVEQMRQEAAK